MSDKYSNDEHEKKKRSKSSDADELREVAQALPELFGALNEAIPRLVSGLIGSVYSPEAAGNMAAGIGKFYKNLIEEGIPEDVALDMTRKFVGALDFSKLMNIIGEETSFESGRKRKRHKVKIDFDDEDEELDEEYDE
ncbi:MAG: hypothetical protein OEV85_12895 [Candidatus Thorarchaeota archaeon]|nr:hypothetical protein [Candidatus Thorarchaeota archaeon]